MVRKEVIPGISRVVWHGASMVFIRPAHPDRGNVRALSEIGASDCVLLRRRYTNTPPGTKDRSRQGCEWTTNQNRTDGKALRRVLVRNSLLRFCYLQLTDTSRIGVTKPDRGFECLPLRHAVCTAEKSACIAPKIARNPRQFARCQHGHARTVTYLRCIPWLEA
jgi:hypothetical protein